ncbi:MAG: hemolysin family protein [Methanocalculaceae archaeon]|jgi:CBS domain containing-hemolysin-like protein|nr:hemolysin family protein [Methanocalculaceae archaeon]
MIVDANATEGCASIVIFAILLILSTFFSASELALVGISRAKIHALSKKSAVGKRLETLKNNPDRFLITILIGNNIANVGAAATAVQVAIAINGNTEITMVIATGVTTLLLLIFGEIGPKTLAARRTEQVALFATTPIYCMTLALSPFFGVYDCVRRIGKNREAEVPVVTEEEIREWIDVGKMEGAIEEDEKEMIYSVLQLNDTIVKDIMTPRPDVAVIEDTVSLEEAVAHFRGTGFSRVPVYHGKIDNIIGTLNIKDLFNAYTAGNPQAPVKMLMFDVYCVPESKKIDDLLRELQVRRMHMAIVLDEFCDFSGVVTLEDILEELVGDIMDESDGDEVADIIEIGKGLYMVDAQVRVTQLNERFAISLPEDLRSYETVGGLVFSRLGHIPKLGESVTLADQHITVVITEMRGRQILKLKLIFPQQKAGKQGVDGE